jgi:hypothetical protein
MMQVTNEQLKGPVVVYSPSVQRAALLTFSTVSTINPLNTELNPICHLLALLGVHFLHISRIKVKSLTLRLLMSYIYRVFQKELYNFKSVLKFIQRTYTTF